jgi:hypothetical protein
MSWPWSRSRAEPPAPAPAEAQRERNEDTDLLRFLESEGRPSLPPAKKVMPAAARRVTELEEALESLSQIEDPDPDTAVKIARQQHELAELRVIIMHATRARVSKDPGGWIKRQIQLLEEEQRQAKAALSRATRERAQAAKGYAQVGDSSAPAATSNTRDNAVVQHRSIELMTPTSAPLASSLSPLGGGPRGFVVNFSPEVGDEDAAQRLRRLAEGAREDTPEVSGALRASPPEGGSQPSAPASGGMSHARPRAPPEAHLSDLGPAD